MKKQMPIWVIGSLMVIATALTLTNLASVPSAQAQVGTPPGTQNPADRSIQNLGDREQPAYDTTTTLDRTSAKQGCKASEVIGLKVRAKSGDQNIGSIKDLMISHDGQVEYVVVAFGGFLGMGDKLFAVPLDAVQFQKTSDQKKLDYARIDVSEQTLRDRKGFDQDHWPAKADRSFLTNDRPQGPVGRTPTPSGVSR